MRLLKCPFAALLAVLAATIAFGAEPSVTLLMPYDGAILHASKAMIPYETTPPQFEPEVTQNGLNTPRYKFVGGNNNDLYHLNIDLVEGKNRLVWFDMENEKELLAITLYYVPPHSLKKVNVAGATKFSFHQKDFEARCNECHSIPEEMETVRGRPMQPAGKVCSACHPGIDKRKSPHKPSDTYDCFRCHETAYKPQRFGINTSIAALCGYCHEGFMEKLLGEKKYVHGPVAGGACLACHDPHGGKSGAITREPMPQLCLRCHDDTVDINKEGVLHGDLDCDECHSPHGGDNPTFVIAEKSELCLSCHDKPTDEMGGHLMPGHPSEGPVDPSKPGKPLWCLSCHKVHSQVDISQTNWQEDVKMQRKFCNRCHY